MKRLKQMAGYMMVVAVLVSVLAPCRMVCAEENKGDENIVTVVSNDKQFSTLAALLKAAGLIDALEGEGPYTVFAPTNEAFRKLSPDVITELLRPENKEKLEDILTYHVYAGKVPSEEAKKLAGKDIIMLNNKKVKITLKNNELYVNNARVLVKDINASNGVIHVIDTVLLPEK